MDWVALHALLQEPFGSFSERRRSPLPPYLKCDASRRSVVALPPPLPSFKWRIVGPRNEAHDSAKQSTTYEVEIQPIERDGCMQSWR